MKQGFNILSRVLGTIIVLFLAVSMVLDSPAVQKRIAAKAVGALNKEFGATVSYSSIRIRPFNVVCVDDLLLRDKNPYTEDKYERGWAPSDTFIFAHKVRATISPWGLFRGEGMHITRAFLDGVDFHIISEPDRKTTDNLSRIFGGEGAPEVPQGGPHLFDIREVDIRNFRFRLTNFNPRIAKTPEFAINFDDLDVRCNQVRAHGLRFSGGRISFAVDKMDLHEKTGYEAWNLKGSARIGFGKVEVFNFHLDDRWSDFSFHKYTMTFKNARAFKDYVNEVEMELWLKECRLGMRTISSFAGILPNNNLLLDIREGSHAVGTVNDMNVTWLGFTEIGSGVSAEVRAHALGLQKGKIALAKSEITEMHFTTGALEKFLRAFDPSIKPDIKGLAPGIPFTFSERSDGPLADMTVSCSLTGPIGTATFDSKVKELGVKETPTIIEVSADTKDFNLGKFLGTDALGKCSLEARAGINFDRQSFSANLESLFIDKMEALSYEYSNIYGSGSVSREGFDAKLTIDDPNLNLNSEVYSKAVSPSEMAVKAIANLNSANLSALNLDPRKHSSNASCQLSVEVRGDKHSEIPSGNIVLKDLRLEDEFGEKRIGNITVNSFYKDEVNTTTLKSSFLDGRYVGTLTFADLIPIIENVTTREHLGAIYPNKSICSKIQSDRECDIALKFKDSRDILSFVLPGLYIADSTRLNLNVKQDGKVAATMSSDRIAYGKNFIRSASLSMNNRDSCINLSLKGSNLKAGLIDIKDIVLSGNAQRNDPSLHLSFKDVKSGDKSSELGLTARMERTSGDSLLIHARQIPSSIKLSDREWNIAEADIFYRKGRISVNNFDISNGERTIILNGALDQNSEDTLKLAIRKLDIGATKAFTDALSNFEGEINTDAIIYSPLSEGLQLMADLEIRNLLSGKEEIGDLRMVSAWDNKDKRFNIFLANNIGNLTPMSARGWFKPDGSQVDLAARLDNFHLAAASPFLYSIFSEIGGTISGQAHLGGSLKAPQLSSESMRLNNVVLKPELTGVQYTIDGPLSLDGSGIRLENATIRDPEGGSGTISGGLLCNKFKDFKLNAGISAKKLLVLDTRKVVEGVSGHLYADADARVTGPLDNITISGKIATVDVGEINIALGSAVAKTGGKLLNFKTPYKEIDPYEFMLRSHESHQKKRNAGNLNIKLNALIGSGTKAFVDLIKDSGNTLTAQGSGNVNLDISTSTDKVNVAGDYNLTGGKYHFEIPGVVGMDFNIKDGSYMKFAGDIKSTVVNLDASYNLKTSLSSLLADSSSVSTRRNVECLIHVTGPLLNPNVGFGINIPDLDPMTKSRVQAALDTEDKIQQQFVSLLAIGSFLPGEQSGVFNGGNVLYSNVGSIMSSQLNSILQQLNIPLDLGLGYQQTGDGKDMFDVAISTQLFNNRVEVAGSVGNRQFHTSSSSRGDVVGDIDIEYKINPAGTFRLKAFSHSADEFSGFLEYAQRNGLGITFQKGFDTFRNLIRDIFSSRSKKEERALEKEDESRKMITFTLDE